MLGAAAIFFTRSGIVVSCVSVRNVPRHVPLRLLVLHALVVLGVAQVGLGSPKDVLEGNHTQGIAQVVGEADTPVVTWKFRR